MSELFLNRPGPIRYGWRAADRVRETAEDVARSDVAAGDALLAEEDGFVAPVARGAAFIERLRTYAYGGIVWFRGTEGWNCSDCALCLPTPGSSGRSGRGRCQHSKR